MAVPDVDKKLLGELEAMGFSVDRATRALQFSGGSISVSRCITRVCGKEDACSCVILSTLHCLDMTVKLTIFPEKSSL